MSAIDSKPVPDGHEWMGPKGPWPDLSNLPDEAPPLGGSGPTPGPPPHYKPNPGGCVEGVPEPDPNWKPHPPLVDLSGVPDTAPPLGMTHEELHAEEVPSLPDIFNFY